MAPSPEQINTPSSTEADKIASLITSANLQYSLKNYDAASELYSRATELQAERNGDMAPENADLLYLYGRCLYKVALAKSNVLGGNVAGPSEKPKKKSKTDKAESSKAQEASAATEGSDALPSADDKLAEDIVEAAVESKDGMKTDTTEKPADKPYFMITGDDNWDTDSEGEGDGDEEGAEGEEAEEDDFANAYEILEIARVLLQRQIEQLLQQQGSAPDTLNGDAKGKAPVSTDGDQITPKLRAVKERLADTHDLLAEISLENERFLDAVPDSRESLALKKELHPPESSLVAEAHFKLSLALEFASVTKLREVAERQQEELRQKFHNGADSTTITPNPAPDDIDEDLRNEAAREMEAAIASSKLRVSKEEAALASKPTAEERMKTEQDIADVKEMIEEMEQRVSVASNRGYHCLLLITSGVACRSSCSCNPSSYRRRYRWKHRRSSSWRPSRIYSWRVSSRAEGSD